jgi:integrase
MWYTECDGEAGGGGADVEAAPSGFPMFAPWHLVGRKDKKGVFYCRYNHPRPYGRGYDPDVWRSTHTADPVKAEEWARANAPTDLDQPLQKAKADLIRFSAFAKGWYRDDHDWVIRSRARGRSLTPAYLDNCRQLLRSRILPKWGQAKLSDFTSRAIETWLFDLHQTAKRKRGTRKGLDASTCNHALNVLRQMLDAAVFDCVLKENPAAKDEHLSLHPKNRGILGPDEVIRLFDESRIDEIWGGDFAVFCASRLAMATGMRIGEIQGLRRQDVHLDDADPILIVAQANKRKYGMGDPKCRSTRTIPLTPQTVRCLRRVMLASPYKLPDDLVFASTNLNCRRRGKKVPAGKTPIHDHTIRDNFYAALAKIGVDRMARSIVFHSTRHWFASVSRNSGVAPDHVVMKLTGHKSNAIEGYTHVDCSDLVPVVDLVESRITKAK